MFRDKLLECSQSEEQLPTLATHCSGSPDVLAMGLFSLRIWTMGPLSNVTFDGKETPGTLASHSRSSVQGNQGFLSEKDAQSVEMALASQGQVKLH